VARDLIKDFEVLYQEIVWDAFPHHMVCEILRRLGKVPPSEEGISQACAESHSRLLPVITNLGPEVNLITSIIAEAMVRSIVDESTAEKLGQDIEDVVMTYRNLLRSSALVVLAALCNADLITYKEGAK